MPPTPHHDGHGHAHIEKADEQVKLQETAFIEAYRTAGDKRVFLELTGVHFSLEQEDHAGWHLTHIRIEETFEVGQASPAFGMARLVHHPIRSHPMASCGDGFTARRAWRASLTSC